MESSDLTFQTADGVSLHVRSWAVDRPKAVVQVLHGIAEHGSRYARLAEALGRAGYTTYAHDHRDGPGRARIKIGDETYTVESGNVVYIPAGVAHSYSVVEAPFEFLCLVPNKQDEIRLVDQ